MQFYNLCQEEELIICDMPNHSPFVLSGYKVLFFSYKYLRKIDFVSYSWTFFSASYFTWSYNRKCTWCGYEVISKILLLVLKGDNSRDSSVGILLGYRLDDRSSRVRLPEGAGDFSLHHGGQNNSGQHPAHKALSSNFWPKFRLLKWNTHPIS